MQPSGYSKVVYEYVGDQKFSEGWLCHATQIDHSIQRCNLRHCGIPLRMMIWTAAYQAFLQGSVNKKLIDAYPSPLEFIVVLD